MPPLDRLVEEKTVRLSEFVVGRVEIDHRRHPHDDVNVLRPESIEHLSNRWKRRRIEDERVETRGPARIDVDDAEGNLMGSVIIEHLLNIRLIALRIV